MKRHGFKKVVAVIILLCILIGMLSGYSITVHAAENTELHLGCGFNALTGDFTNPSGKGIGSDEILSGFQSYNDEYHYRYSKYLFSSSQSELAESYKNSLTVGLNMSVPIKAVTASMEAKFSTEHSSSYHAIESHLWELYYSENIQWKVGIRNLNGINGAKRLLTEAFTERLNDIKNETDSDRQIEKIDSLFDEYGTHVITSFYMGGRLEIANHVFSEEEETTTSLQEKSSLKAGIDAGKLKVGVDLSAEEASSATIGKSEYFEDRLIQTYGGDYYSLFSLTNEDYQSWIDSLSDSTNVISFVDQNSLIPIWDLIDNEELRSVIYSRYSTRLAYVSEVKLDSYIYQSPEIETENGIVRESSVVRFSETKNEVAPESTVYFSLPYENTEISLHGNSGSFAAIDDPSYGAVSFKSGIEDGQTVDVDILLEDVLLKRITFTVRKEGVYENSPYQDFAGGYGTEERPFLIGTAAQLENLNKYGYDTYAGLHYKMISDIDFNSNNVLIESFYGTFDGNGYAMQNWKFTSYADNPYNFDWEDHIGIFRVNYGTIKNAKVLHSSIFIRDSGIGRVQFLMAGALCGYNAESGTIHHCVASYIYNLCEIGAYEDDGIWRKMSIGCLCGENAGTVTQCGTFNSTVTAFGMIMKTEIEVRCGAVIGTVWSNDNTAVVTDLYAYNNDIYADGWGGCDSKMFVWSGAVYIHAGGVIGRAFPKANLVDRLVSVKNNIHEYNHYTEQGNLNIPIICGVLAFKYNRYTDNWNAGENNPEHKLAFDSLSDVSFDAHYLSCGWRQDAETGMICFANDRQDSLDPEAFPFVRSVTADSIEMLDLPIFEYKIDDQSWSDSASFTGLAPNSMHYVYVRFAENGTKSAGQQSSAISVKTSMQIVAAPEAPVVVKKTNNTVELQATDGCEYSKDQIKWQDSPLFNELKPDTQYTFYQRFKGTNTAYPSESSMGTTVTTDPVVLYVLGDVDGDNSVSIMDVTCIQRVLALMDINNGFIEAAADVDGDDTVTVMDATWIQRFLALMSLPDDIQIG